MATTDSARPAAGLDDAATMRRADAGLLSLALMDARNRSLAWLGRLPIATRLAAKAGWFQERWIARNVQRARGAAADASQAPLASIEPHADRWVRDGGDPAPEPDAVRAYLAETLEVTLDLLAAAGDSDEALHWYRAALFGEDALVMRFACLAQAQGVDPGGLLGERVRRALRPPVWFPAQRWTLGSPRGGYVPAAEQWAHEEPVPEFEIDAQPVTWSQFTEFVEDGGYDRPELWNDEAARWLEADGRRTPRDVEQLRHGVTVRRFGRLVRAGAGEAASMLSWYEAVAWCRWAGRRLPTEIEWELAASQGASRGVTWGDVPEWTAGHARAWPGGPAVVDPTQRVQRGVAWFEPRRLAHSKARRFADASDDEGFAGFRSCSL